MVSQSVRGGRSMRMKLEAVRASTRAKHPCPRCGKTAVRRKSTGIWICKSCGVEFAGGAYYPSTPVGIVVNRLVSEISKR